MDIERAEYGALQGARDTLQRYRPRLALCVYHYPKDFVQLARLIHGTKPGYRFYLAHAARHAEETVLFAAA